MSARKPFFRPHLAFTSGSTRAPSPASKSPIPASAAPTERSLTDEEARRFRELILPHLDGAYNLARYLARDGVAAEDIVQDAFLRAFRAFPSFRGGAPKAWLFAIVRNCFRDWVGARSSSGRILVGEGALSQADTLALANASDPDQASPEEALSRTREARTVRAVIENLPEPFRETLILREMEELPYKEIATLTGAPIGTVMSRLARARQMLCDVLMPDEASAGVAKRGEGPVMTAACPDRAMLLHGLLDGELDAANAVTAETHLKTCEACNAEFLRQQRLRDAIAAPGVAWRAPAGLGARIEQSLAKAVAPVRRRRLSGRAPAWAGTGALGAIAASLAVLVVMPSLNDSQMENQLIGSHVRSLLANHLTDVETSNKHVVKPWFNGKIDFAPPVPDLADQGFPLAGGRLDYVSGKVVPALVYHRRLHTINVFIWPIKSGAIVPTRTLRRDGYSLVEWKRGDLEFWAVSDIDAVELRQFQQDFAQRS